MKLSCITSMILTSLPLLLYPFILIANIMSLAGTHANPPPPFIQTAVAYSFLWSSTLYPAPWLLSLIGSFIFLARKEPRKALLFQIPVWAYSLLVGSLFAAWIMVG